ncbi:MAG: FAD-dependent oxidoreductase [Solirubrobacteraceae bacterium]|nr:FAD-dependent oxidoreductase [Solirubrobacteraceae bacterium]
MPDETTDVLLIGGGIASASAARELRDGGFDGRITLVTRELDVPYHRPPGTKEVLRGEAKPDASPVLPPEWYEANDVDLRTRTSVLALDPAERTVRLQTKATLGYDRALLATGANVRRLAVDGAGLVGIHYVRSLRNGAAVRRDLEGLDAPRVVLVGGSYIGCEAAASLASQGVSVTVLMLESEPLERTFGPEVGAWVRRRLEAGGVEVRGGVDVRSFVPVTPDDDESRVAGVALADGTTVPADLVICGVGAVPDVMLGKRAGLTIGAGGGILADDRLRTSAEGLWVAGDIAEPESALHGGPVRIEHEDVAARQGAYVARQWLGADEPYAVVPYFFSDLADWVSLEALGAARTWDRTVVEGSLDDDAFAVWLVDGDRVRGYARFNGAGDLDRARDLIAAGGTIDAAVPAG